MSSPKTHGENRPKLDTTTPPSTPQGPQSNDQLVAPEYRDGPYPGDRDDLPNGEGSTVATHATGITPEGREATRESSHDTDGSPVLNKHGRDPLKKEGREKNEP